MRASWCRPSRLSPTSPCRSWSPDSGRRVGSVRLPPLCPVCSVGAASHIKKSLIAAECARADIREERRVWTGQRQPRMREQPHRLVFLDETYVNTKMTRLRGRSLKGQRLRTAAPCGHWKTHTFIAGLRCHELSAPWIIDGPITRSVFEAYIETQLAPTLSKGDVVIL